MCLLEVVPEDLLELALAVAEAVDAVGPGDEALMEGGPRAHQDSLVGGVADEDVLKAKGSFPFDVGAAGIGLWWMTVVLTSGGIATALQAYRWEQSHPDEPASTTA